MIISNFISPKILNSKVGLIKEITQWLPEYDDPRICVVAALMSNTEYLGLPKMGSVLNSGASVNLQGAVLAAIGESLERYCAAIVPNNLPLCTYVDLENAVPPSRFEFYSDKQYDSAGFPFQKFCETSKVAWVKGVEIESDLETWIPAATIYLPYFAKRQGETNIWAPVSTGLACASDSEQAILSGLFEVIERDAFMLFWLLGRSVKCLDWKKDPDLSFFVNKFFGHSIQNIRLLDITTDIGVPTVLGVYTKPGEGLLVSAAARPTFVEAAKKALIELAQGRITWRKEFERTATVGTLIPAYDNIRSFEDHVNLFMNPAMKSQVPFLFVDDTVNISDLKKMVCEDLSTVSELTKHLKNKGYSSYCIDLTADELVDSKFCVYRSLIPGLLEISNDHFWQRLGNTRISDYFNSMGDKRKCLYSPDSLNPVPHPFP